MENSQQAREGNPDRFPPPAHLPPCLTPPGHFSPSWGPVHPSLPCPRDSLAPATANTFPILITVTDEKLEMESKPSSCRGIPWDKVTTTS